MGLGDTSAVVFLRIRFGLGEAAGDLAADGDAAFSTAGVASTFFSVRCFGDEADSRGVPVSNCDWTCATEMVRPITNSNARILVPIKRLANRFRL